MARKVAEDRLDDAHRYATGSPETRAIIFALDALGLRVLAAADRVAAVLADR
jgi:hypothetical protein